MLLLLQIGLTVKGIDCERELQLGLKEGRDGRRELLMAGDLFLYKKKQIVVFFFPCFM